MKTALVTGIIGQDGSYLAEHLLSKGYQVVGLIRRSSSPNLERISDFKDKISLEHGDILDQPSLQRVFEKYEFNEVYNLAAQSFVGLSWEQPIYTTEVNAVGTLKLLEVIRTVSPKSKFYQASTSEMFGLAQEVPQTEKTPFYPRSPYGVSKLYAHWMTVNYRESYNLFTCSGILFNHESPRRGNEFVTKKIVNSIKRNELLRLGNLYSKRDWGYALEYVEVMYKMLQLSSPEDFVIATGETHTIKEFVAEAFSYLNEEIHFEGSGLDEKGYTKSGKLILEIDPKMYRPAEVNLLVGDASKAKKILGWEPKVKFTQLVELMMKDK
ncbi:MAG: GDP-mannose 4,6-dehydratase [Spirochaetes bacterium GWF1_51_8]|nr:MAG: GDP-mannose 4,6-dehydratase [Spirochaetes bacterium GWF1_51_8]